MDMILAGLIVWPILAGALASAWWLFPSDKLNQSQSAPWSAHKPAPKGQLTTASPTLFGSRSLCTRFSRISIRVILVLSIFATIISFVLPLGALFYDPLFTIFGACKDVNCQTCATRPSSGWNWTKPWRHDPRILWSRGIRHKPLSKAQKWSGPDSIQLSTVWLDVTKEIGLVKLIDCKTIRSIVTEESLRDH